MTLELQWIRKPTARQAPCNHGTWSINSTEDDNVLAIFYTPTNKSTERIVGGKAISAMTPQAMRLNNRLFTCASVQEGELLVNQMEQWSQKQLPSWQYVLRSHQFQERRTSWFFPTKSGEFIFQQTVTGDEHWFGLRYEARTSVRWRPIVTAYTQTRSGSKNCLMPLIWPSSFADPVAICAAAACQVMQMRIELAGRRSLGTPLR